MRTLLVDADVIAFKIASVIEKQVCDDEGYIHFWWADEGEGRDKVDIYLNELVEDLHADDVIICLSDPKSRYFRHEIHPDYKGNRTGKKPLVLKALKQHMADNYNSYVRPGLEADDIVGILLTHPKIIKGEKVSASVDKDFKTIPGLHADLGDRDIFEIEEDEAAA